MKKRKTALIIILSVLVLSILFSFVPINSLLSKIPLVKNLYNNTILSINLKDGEANVTINDKDYGETPVNVENLADGEYTVVLSKITDSEGFYEDHTFDINLTQNTETRIDMEIGPNNLLHGIVLYYSSIPKGTENTGLLTVTSTPLDADITLDTELLNKTPLSGHQLTKGQYTIKISKDGYEEVEAPIIVREGYHLNVKGYLFPIPLTLETATNE
jgi:hypothetical protein